MTQDQAQKIWQLSLAMADAEREYQKVIKDCNTVELNPNELNTAHFARVNAMVELADYLKSCIE